jgi:hypothetical protein
MSARTRAVVPMRASARRCPAVLPQVVAVTVTLSLSKLAWQLHVFEVCCVTTAQVLKGSGGELRNTGHCACDILPCYAALVLNLT